MLMSITGCSTTKTILINDFEEVIKKYYILMPDFPKPQKNIYNVLQEVKINNKEHSDAFYDYFKKLMIFEKQYNIFKKYLDE